MHKERRAVEQRGLLKGSHAHAESAEVEVIVLIYTIMLGRFRNRPKPQS